MLTLTYTPNAYQQAANLLPTGSKTYKSRPAFFQVVADNINRAIGWNDACLMEIFGGVYVWHGSIFEQVKDSLGEAVSVDLNFSGSRFQGLMSLGNREERIYIGNGKTVYYIHRNVIEGAEVEGVELKPETLELIPDETETLSAVIQPSWAKNKTVSWLSDKPDIAEVDEDGIVTAKALGSAVITVTTEDGSFTDTSTVEVIPYVPVTGVDIDDDEITLVIEDEHKISYQIQPENATNPDVYWLSDNPEIATVSSWGTVFALTEGETKIEVRTKEGHHTDTCKVIVTAEEQESTQQQSAKTTRSAPLLQTDQPKSEEGFYEAIYFDNEFVDSEDDPYPLPKAKSIATWRNRLWAADGTHIIYHCRNENPHHWEPLDAIPIQGGDQSEVTGLCAMGNRLIVSTMASLWQVVGDSPYNWEFQAIVHGHGAMNNRSLATDGLRLFYLDRWGVYELGKPTPISKPIEILFFTPDYSGELLLEASGEYLYLLLNGRLLVYHTLSEQWGEVLSPFTSDYAIKGLVNVGGHIAFYGDHGLWLSGSQYGPDRWLNRTEKPVISTLRTWPVQPNTTGDSALNRIFLEAEGLYRAEVTYRVYSNSQSEPLAQSAFNSWHYLPPSLEIQQEPLEVLFSEQPQLVNKELPLQVSSAQFEHEIQASGYIRVHGFKPYYQFTPRE